MNYTDLVTQALDRLDELSDNDRQLLEFCQKYEQTPSVTKMPTSQEWEAYYKYCSKIKRLKKRVN